MTSRDGFLAKFHLSEAEQCYKGLYQRNPDAFQRPVHSWQEFVRRYGETLPPGTAVALPTTAPTPIDNVFDETAFFPHDLFTETGLLVNAPYCPAFLHRLTFIKLIYVFRGQYTFFYNGQRREMGRGSLCIVAPEVEQAVFSHSDEDIVLNLLVRRSTFLEAFEDLLSEHNSVVSDFFWKMLYNRPDGRVLILEGEPDSELEEYIMDLYEEALEAPRKSQLAMRSLMTLIFGCVIRNQRRCNASHMESEAVQPYPMIQYRQYMKRHLDTVSLAKLAEEFYVSEGYLSRYIRRETGHTFSQLLLRMRMTVAADLLRNTDCSLETIVSRIGYRDQSIFFRNFRAFYGMPPMAYRKMNRHPLGIGL